MLNFIITSILLVFIIILYYTNRYHTYWSRHGIKGPNLIQSLKSYTRVLALNDYDLNLKYGNIIGLYEIFRKMLIINDPDLIKDILIKDFHVFTNRRFYHFGQICSISIVNSRDHNWKRIRTIVSPSFTSVKLKAMIPTISKIGDQFCDNISAMAKKGSKFDIKLYVDAFTLDVLCSCCFGIEIESIKDPKHPVVENVSKCFSTNLSFSGIMGYAFPQIAKILNLEVIDPKAVDYLRQIIAKIVESRKSKTNLDEYKTDFMQLMIDANQEIISQNNTNNRNDTHSGERIIKTISEEEMTATAIAYFIGGYDTTSATLSHFCYFIAKYPEIQEILFQEISKLQKLDDESLANSKYLNAVIAETLRLAPPGNRIDREAAEDYKLGNTGIVIPKGTLVTFSAYTIQHNPNNFEDPFEFRPERFMSDELNYNQFAYIPWGLGPRMCVGMRFAMNEMRIFIAKLIQKFRLIPAPNSKLEYFNGNLLFIPKEVMVIAEERD